MHIWLALHGLEMFRGWTPQHAILQVRIDFTNLIFRSMWGRDIALWVSLPLWFSSTLEKRVGPAWMERDPSQDDEKNTHTFAWSTAAHLTNFSLSFSLLCKNYLGLMFVVVDDGWMFGSIFGVGGKGRKKRKITT